MGLFSKKNKIKAGTDSVLEKKQEGKNSKKSKKESSNSKDKKAVSMKDLYGNKTKNTKTSAKTGTKKKPVRQHGNAYKILIKPLITEKAGDLGSQNKYVFVVAVTANKISIAEAIDEVYGIKPIAVNVINMKGKKIRTGKELGKRKDWKKAIVTLPEGKSINIYEGI